MIGWPCGTSELLPHEDGGKFRDVVALRAFLDVLEIVEAEADHLAGRRHRQGVFQALERSARGPRRALRRILERRQVAVVASEHLAEIARDALVDRLQINHLVALDHAETQSAIGFKSDNFHGSSLTCVGRF
jgi:hypothetical protein